MEASPSSKTADNDQFYTRAFALVTFLVLAVALYKILMPFLGPLMWAVFLAFLLHPLHRRLTKRLRNKPQASAFILTLFVVVLFVGPLTGLSAAFAAQVGDLLRFVQSTLADQTQTNGLDLTNVPWIRDLLTRLNDLVGVDPNQVRQWVEQGANQGLHWLASFGGKVFL